MDYKKVADDYQKAEAETEKLFAGLASSKHSLVIVVAAVLVLFTLTWYFIK